MEQEKKPGAFVVFLYCHSKHTLHFDDFWLCACAFSTLTTIFCSSIRNARLILEDKEHPVRTPPAPRRSGARERPPHLSRTHLAHMEPPYALLTCFLVLESRMST